MYNEISWSAQNAGADLAFFQGGGLTHRPRAA